MYECTYTYTSLFWYSHSKIKELGQVKKRGSYVVLLFMARQEIPVMKLQGYPELPLSWIKVAQMQSQLQMPHPVAGDIHVKPTFFYSSPFEFPWQGKEEMRRHASWTTWCSENAKMRKGSPYLRLLR